MSGVYSTKVIGAREYDGGSPEGYIFKAQIDRIDHNALARTNEYRGAKPPVYRPGSR